MAFWEQARQWYFHDLWKRTASTWGDGAGYTWQRVELGAAGGPKQDYPEFAQAETRGNITRLASYGQQGIARRWRWNGSAWQLEETRSTSDTGALPEKSASELYQQAADDYREAADLAVLIPVVIAAAIFYDVVR